MLKMENEYFITYNLLLITHNDGIQVIHPRHFRTVDLA